MKIKLIINGCENPEDYKLLKTTISTVASLRKTAVLRFNSERLVIISTPKSASNSSSTILHGDSGQLWCTIPQDVFKQYTVLSVRDSNAITMEYNCDTLLSVFKRYDKIMNQGSFSDMTIKLQAMPEWNSNVAASSGSTSTGAKPNPIVALGITFGEILHTAGEEDVVGQSEGRIADGFGSCKTITHSFKVPVKLMFKAQDARIQEPMVNYTQLMMYRLPPYSGEFGAGFSSFIKRVERYTNVNHIRLSAIKKRDALDSESHQLKIRVNDLDWQLEICWNGPLDAVIQQNAPSQSSENGKVPEPLNNNRGSEEGEDEDSMRIDESTITDAKNATSNSLSEEDVQLADVSAIVEQAERDNAQAHEVMIKCKDWKVCHKLYSAFEEVVLAISHNESCVLHCSLDRGILDESEDIDKPKERGQIIYYMARSKPI
ncbi:MEC3 (YLR288C) [Zygosaccharomyces parabailii]|nr:MEC3 (YLR288C) [Zygosaccharomyces parabailii]CDH11867.1 probable DNA damage checkpoint control protein MEC3 [Zygosaccharomyces bailii ISA1307]